MICHNRIAASQLIGVARTTSDTSKSQPTAYCFAQLKQETFLIQLNIRKIAAGLITPVFFVNFFNLCVRFYTLCGVIYMMSQGGVTFVYFNHRQYE